MTSELSAPITMDKFDNSFQEAMIGHMLQAGWFASKSISLLKPGYFTDANLSVLFACVQKYHTEFKVSPTPEELKGYVYTTHFTTYTTLHTKIDHCIASSNNQSRDFVSKSATGWLKMIMFRNYLAEAAHMYNTKKSLDTIDWVDRAIAKVKECSFLHNESFDFSNPEKFYEGFNTEMSDCLTLGHPDLDELLLPGSKINAPMPSNKFVARHQKHYSKGSLARGDTTMIIAPSNGGKTTAVISILVANMISGKKCLLVTHEQNARDIADKIYQCYFQMTRQQLMDPEMLKAERANAYAKFINDHLTYVPWVKAGSMFVEDVIDMIKEKNAFMRGNSKNNKGYDLVIDDYPGKLSSRNTGKDLADHAVKTFIYDQFVTMAIEEQFHVITPLQANRGGFQKAKNLKEGSSMIDQADVADAYNIVQRASNIITLNASGKDKNAQIVRFLIAKSRSSATAKVFVSKTNYAMSTTHSVLNNSTTYDEGSPKEDTLIYSALKIGAVHDAMLPEETETQKLGDGHVFGIPT
jgi:KaiC/GvpD/RAD55 family RecA-like ATPase